MFSVVSEFSFVRSLYSALYHEHYIRNSEGVNRERFRTQQLVYHSYDPEMVQRGVMSFRRASVFFPSPSPSPLVAVSEYGRSALHSTFPPVPVNLNYNFAGLFKF